MFETDCVFYTFLNCSYDRDEILYGDGLNLGEEDWLQFIKILNTKQMLNL